jgi:tetratricopeptide (TPR) repeat protein
VAETAKNPARQLIEEGYRFLDEANVTLSPRQAILNCEQALEKFKKARELAADDEELLNQARAGLADAYSQRGHQQRYARSHKEAVADLSLALRFNPDLTEDYYYRALSYLEIKDQKNARNDFLQYLRYGKIEFLKLEANKRLEELAPKGDQVALAAHMSQEGARLSSEATGLMHPPEGITPDPDGAVALYNRALDSFRKALELSPKDFLARMGLLAALKSQTEGYVLIQEYDLAIQNLSDSLNIKPDPQVLFQRAEIYRLVGQTQPAAVDFEEFLRSGNDPELKEKAQTALAELKRTRTK